MSEIKEPMDCALCEAKAPERKQYKYDVVLNPDKTWNEEIKRYIFIDPFDTNKIVITEHKNIDFMESGYCWRMVDHLTDGIFSELKIKRIN